jgi:hypothetical protein
MFANYNLAALAAFYYQYWQNIQTEIYTLYCIGLRWFRLISIYFIQEPTVFKWNGCQ